MKKEEPQEVLDLISSLKKEDSSLYSEVEHLKKLLFDCNLTTLYQVIESVYAIDIALALERFDNQGISDFYEKVDAAHGGQVLEQANSSLQRRIVRLLPQEQVLKLFSYMSKDDIADILGNLPFDLSKSLLNLHRDADNVQLQTLLQYEKDTAGGIMTTEYIALRESLNAEDALIKIKKIAPRTEVIETIFVLNHENQLVGSADLRKIFTAEDSVTLGQIMDQSIVTVTPEIDQEEVALLVSKYDLKVIPVTSRRGALLGIITVDDIIDVLLDEQTEDILKFSGISGEEGVSSGVLSSVTARLPWLLVNLVTASLGAFLIQQFEATITQVVALSAIMPIVAATSGNSGSQTLAIIIRGITLGELSLKEDYLRVFKEMAVGMINSSVIGGIASLVIYIMYGNFYLSLILYLAMFLNSFIASSCGFFIPLTLKTLKLDPALASSIFLTATTDIMAFFIFLGLASHFLEFLL